MNEHLDRLKLSNRPPEKANDGNNIIWSLMTPEIAERLENKDCEYKRGVLYCFASNTGEKETFYFTGDELLSGKATLYKIKDMHFYALINEPLLYDNGTVFNECPNDHCSDEFES